MRMVVKFEIDVKNGKIQSVKNMKIEKCDGVEENIPDEVNLRIIGLKKLYEVCRECEKRITRGKVIDMIETIGNFVGYCLESNDSDEQPQLYSLDHGTLCFGHDFMTIEVDDDYPDVEKVVDVLENIKTECGNVEYYDDDYYTITLYLTPRYNEEGEVTYPEWQIRGIFDVIEKYLVE